MELWQMSRQCGIATARGRLMAVGRASCSSLAQAGCYEPGQSLSQACGPQSRSLLHTVPGYLAVCATAACTTCAAAKLVSVGSILPRVAFLTCRVHCGPSGCCLSCLEYTALFHACCQLCSAPVFEFELALCYCCFVIAAVVVVCLAFS
jgi:hypothetical protein